MPRKPIALWGFLVAAALFLVSAVIPLIKGGRLNTTFLVLGVVFGILGANVVRRHRRANSPPPAA